MMKKIMYLLLALSLGLNAGLLVMTLLSPDRPPLPDGEGGIRPGPPPDAGQLVDNHMQGMTRHLDLDPVQQESIRAILTRDAQRLMELQMETRAAGRRLTRAFGAPIFSPEAFLDMVREASVTREALDSLSAALLVAEAAVLTPEQRIKYAEVAPMIHTNPQQARPPHDLERRPPPRR